MAQWKDIISFSLKVILFSLPFIALGLLIERDIISVPRANRFAKICVLVLFAIPAFLFGILNYMAPGLPDAFWDGHPSLESFWIMEGEWAPIVLMALVAVFVVLYAVEVLGGDLTR
jgi:hypothetical protein